MCVCVCVCVCVRACMCVFMWLKLLINLTRIPHIGQCFGCAKYVWSLLQLWVPTAWPVAGMCIF
jgi:hypothetical protein